MNIVCESLTATVERFVAIATHAQWHIAIFLHKTPARAKILEIKNFHMASDHVIQLLSGVVQGSDIGPLLFLSYVNELAEILGRAGINVICKIVCR